MRYPDASSWSVNPVLYENTTGRKALLTICNDLFMGVLTRGRVQSRSPLDLHWIRLLANTSRNIFRLFAASAETSLQVFASYRTDTESSVKHRKIQFILSLFLFLGVPRGSTTGPRWFTMTLFTPNSLCSQLKPIIIQPDRQKTWYLLKLMDLHNPPKHNSWNGTERTPGYVFIFALFEQYIHVCNLQVVVQKHTYLGEENMS